jgi:hypothetical protein
MTGHDQKHTKLNICALDEIQNVDPQHSL